MKRLILALTMAAVLLLSSITVVSAATEDEINESIVKGLAWLANDQEGDGSWPDFYGDEATTGLALLKLCEYAKEQGLDPYDPDYVYSSNVTAGLNYLYSRMSVVNLSLQNHTAGASGTMDDPDSNGNGVGIYMPGYSSYTTSIGLSALSVCGLPGRVVAAPNTVVDNMTQANITQDMVDWLAWAQSDYHYNYSGDNDCGEGGWYYWALDNSNNVPDNSNTGYAVLGLAYAEDFGSTVPQWVKTELNAFVECIQDPVNGDANDGGSWYRNINDTSISIGTNILKTGNLIFEMAFVGDAPNESRVTDATDYLARHWNDTSGTNQPPGWNGTPAQYHTMFTAMKGLEFMGIDTFNGIDWYEDFSDVIVAQQQADGSWNDSSGRGNPTIITAWALLTLEKSSPETQKISVFVDIKPGSCPNPINTKSKGLLPVAILGTEDFDVTTIDPASIQMRLNTEDPDEEGVDPIRWNYEDVATPFEGELCDCHDLNGDGYMDLTLKFDTQEVVALNLLTHEGETLPLTITGNLKEESGGTAIEGQDCVWVLETAKGKNK